MKRRAPLTGHEPHFLATLGSWVVGMQGQLTRRSRRSKKELSWQPSGWF